MRYLVLLFVAAFMMLNEPSNPVVDNGQSAVDDQGVSSDVAPATMPTTIDVQVPNAPAKVADFVPAQAPNLAMSPEVLRYTCFTSASTSNNSSPTASIACSPASRSSREAVHRYLL